MSVGYAPGFSSFKYSPPLNELASYNQKAYNCIVNSPKSPSCDAIIGNINMPGTLCASPTYQQSIYCACVNGPSQETDLVCAFAPCADSAFSYKPIGLKPYMSNCPPIYDCYDVLVLGGQNNVSAGVDQRVNCDDSPEDNRKRNIIIILLIAVFISFVISVTTYLSSNRKIDLKKSSTSALRT